MQSELTRHSATRKLALTPVGQGQLRLEDVVVAHRRHEGHLLALSQNLGDAHLCATNAVFRNIRAETLARGFRFSATESSEYFTFPLMSLERVLVSRVIPYCENFRWIEGLAARAPGRFSFEDARGFELRYNYLFHESAHCIAHDVFFGRLGPAEARPDGSSLVRMMLGEAYANTVEAFCSILVTGELDAYFIKANSHFALDMQAVAKVLAAMRELGAETAFKGLLFAFLYSNFLYESLGERELSRVCEWTGGGMTVARLAGLAEIALELSQMFRMQTSRLYLMQLGYGESELAALEADPFDLIAADARLGEDCRRGAASLAEIACGGLEDEFTWS